MKNMHFKRKLPVPQQIKERYPLTPALAAVKEDRDRQLREIFTGESDRMVLVVGPCSADREDAVLEYCTRLARLQEEVRDRLVLVPRVYTNKPRTTGEGYKGLLHQPDPEGAYDLLEGVIAIRLPLGAVGAGAPVGGEDLLGTPLHYVSEDDHSIRFTAKAHTAYFMQCK